MHRIVKDIAMEWCDFPFGRHHAVPGDEDKPGESSWKLFLNSTDFRESRMRASPAVPWAILISGIPHWEQGPQGSRWIGGELSGILYLEPETPAFSRRVLRVFHFKKFLIFSVLFLFPAVIWSKEHTEFLFLFKTFFSPSAR